MWRRNLFSLALLLLLNILFYGISYASVKPVSHSELMLTSDLVIMGEVVKVEQTGKMQKIPHNIDIESELNLATIKVYKILKGKLDAPTVIVEFIKISPDLEADVQDAQFAVKDKGTVYLKKLPNGNYKALGGWLHGLDKGGWFK